MGAICIYDRSHNKAAILFSVGIIQRPFRMVKCKAFRRRNSLNKLSCTVSNQQTFVRSVTFPNKLSSCFSTKIKERYTLGSIVCKGGIASLFTVIPHGIATVQKRFSRICNTRTKQTGASNSKCIVVRNTSVIRPAKKLLRRSESTFCILHLPCTLGFKFRSFFIVSRIGHIDDHRIAIIQNFPPWNRSISLDIKLYRSCFG